MSSSSDYTFHTIEQKWLNYYKTQKPFTTDFTQSENKFYCLEMFPYPSGKIHMGHVRNYTIGDVVARFQKLNGCEVLHPIGWDAFGLPAENAAIERQVHPAKWTFANIDNMKKQLKKLAFSYDWDNEICTAKEDYYKWGQYIFLKLYEKGLVFKKKSFVNWCPECATVLANEQVENGKCWRHSHVDVIKKDLEQWFFKITDYAQELLDGHEELRGQWPDRVLTMQNHWIGRSLGAQVNFVHERKGIKKAFPIFTTRPDTIFGVTYMAMAFDREDIWDFVTNEVDQEDIKDFIERSKALNQNADYEKEGRFTGSYLTNPFTGDKVPLYLANFVLADYGTGAVMAVPAHDQRDFEFASKYNLPKRIVIQPKDKPLEALSMTEAYTGNGTLVDSGDFSGMANRKAIEAIIGHAEKEGFGEKTINYKLKDWLISRQRYWGNPIPIVHCDDCGAVPVPENQLPVVLPEDVTFQKGVNPLETNDDFVNTTCPKCNKPAKRETETMDTFTCSSWYFLRYTDPNNQEKPFGFEQAKQWMPVDQYIGGIEHACMHLLYARFFHKVLRDIGLASGDEPFIHLLTQGMVVAPSYYSAGEKRYYNPKELDGKEVSPKTGESLVIKMDKMSKSKNNGIDPDDMVEKYGADTVRMFSMFAAPPEKDLEWNEKGVEGCHRFLNRVWRWSQSVLTIDLANLSDNELSSEAKKIRSVLHKTIKKVTEDMGVRRQFNTAISSLMEFINVVFSFQPQSKAEAILLKEALKNTTLMLSPIAPMMADELGELVGLEKKTHASAWPTFNDAFTQDESVEIVFQVNGKIRAKAEVPTAASKEELIDIAKRHEKLLPWIDKKEMIKEIVVPKKLVNLVVKG